MGEERGTLCLLMPLTLFGKLVGVGPLVGRLVGRRPHAKCAQCAYYTIYMMTISRTTFQLVSSQA